ncbi:cold shock domain-containing protein [Streptomyces anulatus]|uniref:cold-shock protein n=1 Tax=Streptomyces anulatus TaxID=1892 RepID=UPI002F91ABC6
MASGTVKSYNPERGFGYITPDGGGADVWFHHSSINGTGFENVSEGQTVEYTARSGQKGPIAESVQPAC